VFQGTDSDSLINGKSPQIHGDKPLNAFMKKHTKFTTGDAASMAQFITPMWTAIIAHLKSIFQGCFMECSIIFDGTPTHPYRESQV
jgi:hypothetical protein